MLRTPLAQAQCAPRPRRSGGAAYTPGAGAMYSMTECRKVTDLLADGVVSACELVGRVPFSRDLLLGVEELPVRASAHTIHNHGLTIDQDCAWNMLS